MKAAIFDYIRPDSLADAVTQLAQSESTGKTLAGSQSLGPMLNMRLARPERVVDISRLTELQQVRQSGGMIQIGAGVTHAAIEDGLHEALASHPMRAVSRDIAYRAVRTRGTIGGSLAHADPAADWVVVLSALNATVQIAGSGGNRSVPIHAFFHGAYTTDLADHEILSRVDIPELSANARWGYYKTCRKPGEFADASAAVLFDPNNKVARVVLGALDGPPRELPDLAAQIARNGIADTDRKSLIATAKTVVDPTDTVQCKLHAVCIERALQQAGFFASEAA